MTRQRIALISIGLLFTAAAYILVTVLAAMIGWAVAHADTGAATIDPSSAIQKYGWWGGFLVLYVAARWFLRRNAAEHWIAHGRTLSIATAALSVIGSVIGWRFGMDPDVIGLAVVGAVPLAIPSTVKPTASSGTSAEPQ